MLMESYEMIFDSSARLFISDLTWVDKNIQYAE